MGLPEYVAIVLMVAALTSLSLWWASGIFISWKVTQGEILSARIESTHANSQNYPTKVSVAYRYDVNGAVLTSTWEGFWPSAQSPNALPPAGLGVLTQRGHRLTVLYDMHNPRISRLHYTSQDHQLFYALLSAVLLGTVMLYGLRIYPVWRNY